MKYPELQGHLYHGSSVAVRNIDVTAGAKRKDFGQGFYTTTSKDQAEKFARLKAKRNSMAFGYVSVFEYIHNSEVNIQYFATADIHWLEYIIHNRQSYSNSDQCNNKYDIVIGPVADDEVGIVVNNFLAGVYGDKDSMETKKTAIRLLESEKLRNQVFFGTKKGADCLTYREAYRVATY